jgi:hypothetical protein
MPYKNREQQLNYLKTWRARQKGKKPVTPKRDESLRLKKETFEGGYITRQDDRKPLEEKTEADIAFEEALARTHDEESETEDSEDETEDSEDEEPQQKTIDIHKMYRQADAIQVIPSKYFNIPHGTLKNMIEDIVPHINSWNMEKLVKLADETFTDNELFVKRCYFLHLLNEVDPRHINKCLPNHIRKSEAYQSSYTRKRIVW